MVDHQPKDIDDIDLDAAAAAFEVESETPPVQFAITYTFGENPEYVIDVRSHRTFEGLATKYRDEIAKMFRNGLSVQRPGIKSVSVNGSLANPYEIQTKEFVDAVRYAAETAITHAFRTPRLEYPSGKMIVRATAKPLEKAA